MADAAHTQSTPTSATRAAWDAAYATYRARQTLYDADLKLGAMHAAAAADRWAREELERLYGQGWKGHPDAQAERERMWDAFNEAEQKLWRDFGEPLDTARVELILLDAPDLDAVAIKVELLAAGDYTLGEVGRRGMEIIATDVERLTGIAS